MEGSSDGGTEEESGQAGQEVSGVYQEGSEEIVSFRKVTDPATLERLNSEPTIKVYRAMP